MSVQYLSELEEARKEITILKDKIENLQNANRELNISLMRKSAESSEAEEKLKRWRELYGK